MKATTDIRVTWTSNPVTNEKKTESFERGKNLRDIILSVYPTEHVLPYLSITVDGKRVDPKDSLFVIPESGVNIEVEPEGVETLVAILVSALVGYATYRYMRNKFGDQGQEQVGSIDTIRGQRNRDKRNDPVPIILGQRRVVPQLAAQPWTQSNGMNQTLHLLLSVGHVPLKIEDIRIGDTSISEFGNDVEVEIYDGYQNFGFPQSFPNDVFEEIIDFEFRGGGGQSEIRTTAENTEQISVEVFLPRGLYKVEASGTKLIWRLEYKDVNDTQWITQLQQNENRKRKVRKPFFVTETFSVPKGQYDVRVTLVDRDMGKRRINDFQWTRLKSISNSSPVVTDSSALIGIKIDASQRASGTLDRVNCLATSVVPSNWNDDWSSWRPSGSTTATQGSFENAQGQYSRSFVDYTSSFSNAFSGLNLTPTQNPAEVFRWLIQGPYLKQQITDEKIDKDQLQDFRDFANNKGWTCNQEIEQERTLGEILNSIANTAQAEMTVRQGKFSVSIDEPKDNYSSVFSFKNASDIAFSREFLDPIDGFRVEFENEENDFEKDEIIVGYKDIDSTRGNFERLDLWGVTNYQQAYERGRHKLADRDVRQEVYNFTANIEAADVTRGDLILIQMPTVGIGSSSGRILEIDGDDIVVDEQARIEDDTLDYGVLIVDSTNNVFFEDVVDVTDNNKRITLTNTNGIEVGDRFMFGVKEEEARECLVDELKPQNDLTFEVTAYNYGPQIFDIDGQSIPTFNPISNLPEEEDNLPQPTVRYTRISRDREQTETGIWRAEAKIGYSYPDSVGTNSFDVQLQYREQGEVSWSDGGTQDTQTGEFTVSNLKDRRVYEFRIRTRKEGGSSDWSVFEKFIESNSDEDPPLPKVNGLSLYGTRGNQFNGNDIKIEWRISSTTRSYELGQEPAGADDGGYDPFFKDFLIEVRDFETNEVIRETVVKDTEYNYTFEKNLEDGGPRRKVRFWVYVRGNNNQLSENPSKIWVENLQPPLHSGFQIFPRFSGLEIRWDDNEDVDFRGTRVYVSTTSGFEPGPETLIYDGGDNQVNIRQLEQGTTYYLVYETYDSFGKELANRSSEFEFTTLTATEDLDLGAWAEVDVGTRDQIEEWLQGEADHHETTFFPKIAAGQVVSGVIQATELIESEGLIRVVDDINSPSFETVLGPEVVDGTAYLFHAKDSNTTNLTFSIDESGNLVANNATLSGEISADGLDLASGSFIKSGKSSFDDDTKGFFLGEENGTTKLNIGGERDFVKFDNIGFQVGPETELRGTDAYSNQSIYAHEFFTLDPEYYRTLTDNNTVQTKSNSNFFINGYETLGSFDTQGYATIKRKSTPLRINRLDLLEQRVKFQGVQRIIFGGDLDNFPSETIKQVYFGFGDVFRPTTTSGTFEAIDELNGPFLRTNIETINPGTGKELAASFDFLLPDVNNSKFRVEPIDGGTSYYALSTIFWIYTEIISEPTGNTNELKMTITITIDNSGNDSEPQILNTFTESHIVDVDGNDSRLRRVQNMAYTTAETTGNGPGSGSDFVQIQLGDWKFIQENAEFGQVTN